METVKEKSLYTTCLEQFSTMQDSLMGLDKEAFDKEASRIAGDSGLDLLVVRAIGRGQISNDLSVNNNADYIRKYIQFESKNFSQDQKIETLSGIFHVNEEMIERVVSGEIIPEDEIDVYR